MKQEINLKLMMNECKSESINYLKDEYTGEPDNWVKSIKTYLKNLSTDWCWHGNNHDTEIICKLDDNQTFVTYASSVEGWK